jgi:uncharacterized protein (TIGR02271 family)
VGKALVAVFDEQGVAQQAFDALLEAGFSRDNVRLASAKSVGLTSTSGEGHEHDSSVTDKIANLLGFGKGRETDTYSEAVRRGSFVLSVDVATDDEADRAADIMRQHYPVDIDARAAQWRESGWHSSPGSATTQDTEGETTIPIVEEELKVGKRAVRRGGVRIVSRIIETPVEETIALREQHATVERKAVNRTASEADMAAFKEGTFEVREIAEEPVVAKTTRVVEEIVVGQEVSERTETISDTVRRTDVEVEDLTDQDTHTSRSSGHKRSPRKPRPKPSN